MAIRTRRRARARPPGRRRRRHDCSQLSACSGQQGRCANIGADGWQL